MSQISQPITYEGGCHCGAVRFRVSVTTRIATECNCSICRKKGFIHLIVPPEQFTLLTGAEVLSTYTFNTRTAQHTFCRICGIHSFYHPRSHPHWIDVNLRCLDDHVIDAFKITAFDGVNWQENVATIRNSAQ